jgi:hypothetical protein
MKLSFRKVSSQEAFKKTTDFLKNDVIKHGGSACEIIDCYGVLQHLTVCAVPWGTILINKQVTKFEAWCVLIQDIE